MGLAELWSRYRYGPRDAVWRMTGGCPHPGLYDGGSRDGRHHISPQRRRTCVSLLACGMHCLVRPYLRITIKSCIHSWFTFQKNTQVSFIMNVVFVCEVVPQSRLSAVIDEWHVHDAGKHWLKSCDNQNKSMWLHVLQETYWKFGLDQLVFTFNAIFRKIDIVIVL